jgi:predicted transcriptional regulator
MPKKRTVPYPTNAELEILTVLWSRGPSSVREVRAALPEPPRRGYTTVLKLLQIMCKKGLVSRDETSRVHIYGPAVDEQEIQRLLATDLVERAFGGSARKLIMQALSVRPASEEELAEIRRLLDELGE